MASFQTWSTIEYFSSERIGQGVFANTIASINLFATSKVAFWCWRTLWSPLVVLATVPDHQFGSGSGSKPNYWQIGGRVRQDTRTARVQLNGKLPTCLNWAGCQWVTQLVHLSIHIRLWYLQCVISILSKSRFQQPLMSFCLLSSLQYRLIWYLCFTFDIWYFGLARRSIILVCTRISARSSDYKICKF
jgi:hypothetical protein